MAKQNNLATDADNDVWSTKSVLFLSQIHIYILCVFTQLQNQSELRAPTAEKAAFFLDAAIASRYSSKPDYDEEEHRNSHMLFTLHIYQYRMEKTGKGGSEYHYRLDIVSVETQQGFSTGFWSVTYCLGFGKGYCQLS